MTNARRDGLYLLLLGSIVFLLLGTALESISHSPMIDFKVVYYSARCLLSHSDPYNQAEVLRIYEEEGGGSRALESARDRQVETQYLYLPTAFSVTIPFAMLPFGPAHLLWMTLIVGGLIFASFLIWNLGSEYAPIVSGALICFLLANTELLVVVGNASGIAVSLCVVSVWSFFKERLAALGVLCLAISLSLKPHDTGLVWLYLLLAGGTYRKRAFQTLALFAALNLPTILWVTHVSPHWMQELHSNMSALAMHGGLNDPSPASSGAHGIGMMINLQTALSVFRDDPRFYNPATYLICGSLLLAWSFKTLRSRISPTSTWLALAVIAPLSMLPVYHRQCDATLLLLAVPACAMLWAEGGPIARLALLISATGFVLTGDLTWAIILGLINNMNLHITELSAQILIIVQTFPAPLSLLVMAIFYLWVYGRRAFIPASPEKREKTENAPVRPITV
jgi:hypothetical protein